MGKFDSCVAAMTTARLKCDLEDAECLRSLGITRARGACSESLCHVAGYSEEFCCALSVQTTEPQKVYLPLHGGPTRMVPEGNA